MAQSRIEFSEINLFEIKRILKKNGIKPNKQNCVNYAFRVFDKCRMTFSNEEFKDWFNLDK